MTRLGDDTVHGFDHGRKSEIGTTAVPLVATSRKGTRGVQLKAAADNSAEVYVGNSDVTTDAADATDGFPLSAGEGLFVAVDDASKIHLRAPSGTQKVFYLVL
ncbi:MAG: hypothetical protein KF708_02550 [Pirellulales bacterium]|nr:hypothetical protein [Pirellulales bacterium]